MTQIEIESSFELIFMHCLHKMKSDKVERMHSTVNRNLLRQENWGKWLIKANKAKILLNEKKNFERKIVNRVRNFFVNLWKLES